MRTLWICLIFAVLLPAQQKMPHEAPDAASGGDLAKLTKEPQVIAAGKDQYMTVCAGCHGPMGEGGRGPNLGDGRLVRRLKDAELISAIQNGVPGSDMPPFALPEQKLWELASYVRSLAAPAYDQPLVGDPDRGKALYYGQGGCVRCHMIRGEGGYLGPDLSNAGATRKIPALRESLLEPSKRFVDGYTPVRLTLRSGARIEGVAKNNSNYSIQVIDADGKLHLLQKADLKSLEFVDHSWMPEDYGKRFSEDQINDLIAFLSRQAIRPPTEVEEEREQ